MRGAGGIGLTGAGGVGGLGAGGGFTFAIFACGAAPALAFGSAFVVVGCALAAC